MGSKLIALMATLLFVCSSLSAAELNNRNGLVELAYPATGVDILDLHLSQAGQKGLVLPAWWDESAKLWRASYRPDTPGRWVASVELQRGEVAEKRFVGVVATQQQPSYRDQIVRINGRFFRTAQDALYFPIGQNSAWMLGDRPLEAFAKRFKAMATSGQNFGRLWLCSWGIKPGDGEQLAAVLDLAHENGLRLMLCLANFHDIKQSGDARAFFVSYDSHKKFRELLRYLVARFGHHPALLSWELGNELLYSGVDEGAILTWAQSMQRYLRSLDVHRHPISISLGPAYNKRRFFERLGSDFDQSHFYLLTKTPQRSLLQLLRREGRRVRGFNRLFFLSEFGYGEPTQKRFQKRDPHGLALHNSLYATLFAGHSGLAANWWWDSYIEPRGLDYHYRALASLVKRAEDIVVDGSVAPNLQHTELEVAVLQAPAGALLWLRDRRFPWYRAQSKSPLPSYRGGRLILRADLAHYSRVSYLDTRRASWREAKGGGTLLSLPEFSGDLVVLLRK